MVWKADYEPFGEVAIVTNTIENNLRFPGQYFDQETGNHYNYFRDYNPDKGRYLESDPIGLNGGVNTYTYVYNNPLSFIDFLGLSACLDCAFKCSDAYEKKAESDASWYLDQTTNCKTSAWKNSPGGSIDCLFGVTSMYYMMEHLNFKRLRSCLEGCANNECKKKPCE